ncbi:Zinc finger MYM-type protein 1 [Eumeta japonica]|uniref:Zinc finger MYM-type protein 1 n=1 Tax=Eumeta variegata TaxID=151549 RepID=A0A4C1XY75_EUMVA|nr:Zinc finger MYM-type protein 1 [Eumeta japonica]
MSLTVLGTVDIRNQLDSVYRSNIQKYTEQVDKNRYILSRLIDCVKFCGAFELALRGHDETIESSNAGVFRVLIDFASELDTVMKEHLTSSTVFKGTSKTIQNDILDSVLCVYHKELSNIITKCEYVAVQADQTTDVSTTMQMVMILRYEENGQVHERFWKYLTPHSHTAEGLSSVIITELRELQITPQQLIAQCYDGAVMSGNVGGVQKSKTVYPNASSVHCYAHQLNLIIEKSFDNSPAATGRHRPPPAATGRHRPPPASD